MLKKILLSSFLILADILNASVTQAMPNQEFQSTSTKSVSTSLNSESSTSASETSENTLEFALRCSEPLAPEAWSKICTRLPQIGIDPTTIDPQKIHILSASAIINGIFEKYEDKKTYYLNLLREENIEILKEEFLTWLNSTEAYFGKAKEQDEICNKIWEHQYNVLFPAIVENLHFKKYREGIVIFLAVLDNYKSKHSEFVACFGIGPMAVEIPHKYLSDDFNIPIMLMCFLDENYFSNTFKYLDYKTKIAHETYYGIHAESAINTYAQACLHELGHATTMLMWSKWINVFDLSFAEMFRSTASSQSRFIKILSYICNIFTFKSTQRKLDNIRSLCANNPLIRKIFFHQFDTLDSLQKKEALNVLKDLQKIIDITLCNNLKSQNSFSKKVLFCCLYPLQQILRKLFKKFDPASMVKIQFSIFWTNFLELFQIGGLFSYDGHTFVNPFSDFAVSLDMKLLPRWTHFGGANMPLALREIPTDSQRPRKITISPQPAGFEILSLLMGFDPENLELHSHLQSSQSSSSVVAAISESSETMKKSSEASSSSVIAET